MCLHSPEEQERHHLEHGPLFLTLFRASQAEFSPGLPRSSVLALLLLQCSRSFNNTHTNRSWLHSRTKNGMNFYSSRKGLAAVAGAVLLNTSLHSQQKVRPSSLCLFPGAVTPRCWFPVCPRGHHVCSPAWALPLPLLGKEQNICQRVPVINAILIKIP